jgi:hypothetical protein
MSKDGQIARAKKDLAQRLGIDESQIKVQSVRETDWPDASLGVREPGQAYAQMMVFGYIITLEANGKTYVYHTDDSSRVVLAS